MEKMIKAIFILCAFLFLVQCKQEIKLDLPNNGQVLVVQGEVSTQKDTSFVKLTQTVSYYSTDIVPTIDNAVVSVNGILFKSKGNGIFMPDTPYVGLINTIYNLTVNYNGATYTSSSMLDPMFDIDRVDSVYYPAGSGGPGGGGRREGYAVRFFWTDTRTPAKYTYMRVGRTTLEILQDSFFRNIILMDNSVTKLNTQISRELPRHYQPGDTVTAILKSCDKNMYYFLQAYQMQTSNAPGPFQIPPANLPTNITGGAVGYFSACDVRSFRKGL
jgi:hypothetical protein